MATAPKKSASKKPAAKAKKPEAKKPSKKPAAKKKLRDGIRAPAKAGALSHSSGRTLRNEAHFGIPSDVCSVYA